jgi:co-chaperonin GroES (HSP10)
MTYKPLRDLLLVKVITEEQTSSGIVLPEARKSRFVKLKVLLKGPDVKEDIQPEDIILAEPMVELVDKTENIGLILSQYVMCVC